MALTTEGARRTTLKIKIAGADISADISKDIVSFTYTDNEEGKTDDLQITLADGRHKWLNWLSGNSNENSMTGSSKSSLSVGDTVRIKSGASDYNGGGIAAWAFGTSFQVIEIGKSDTKRICIGKDNVITYAISIDNLITDGASESTAAVPENTGLSVEATIIQRNFEGDGREKSLSCGKFELDTVSGSGFPTQLKLKCTSLSASSGIRDTKRTRAWDNVTLRYIAERIATSNQMECMYIAQGNVRYTHREQYNETDIAFLKRLCKAAGIALKVTENNLVLFDENEFEKKEAVCTFKFGKSNILSWSFQKSMLGASYSSCHVSYTNSSGITIEYTYTPRIDNPGTGTVLEINEKVENREEARKLAMKRLRERNKSSFSMSLSVVGSVLLAGGETCRLKGWGMFDGKYIISSATHSISGSGYTTDLELSRALEEY